MLKSPDRNGSREEVTDAMTLQSALERAKLREIGRALRRSGGNVAAAAAALDIQKSWVHILIVRYPVLRRTLKKVRREAGESVRRRGMKPTIAMSTINKHKRRV
jgi:hypothetical protein